MSRWQRYWFAEGGRWSAAVLRIAIACAVLLTLRQLAVLSTVRIPGPSKLYHPVGILMIVGPLEPPAFVFTALWVVAIGASIAMLVGWFSRAATAISFTSAVALAAASYAYANGSPSWSHQYNVVFLAQLAFLGARGGDALSVDALLRRMRGLSPVDVPGGYQWSIRLVQLAVALMFTGAAFHKLLHGQFTLRWALSDNLRHQLLVRYDLADLPRPALAEWLIDDVWRFRTAAVLNLVSQASPIFACIFVRRPWLRALAGGFFVLETVALGLVVSLENWHWLPLAAVFIDWDRLLAALAPGTAVPAPLPARGALPHGIRRFIVGFVVYDAITALVPRVDQWLRTYPFSGFPMFATIRARAPYDQHLPYAIPGDHFEAISDRPLEERAQRWIDHNNRRLYQVTDPVQFERRLTATLVDIQRRFPEFGIHGLRHYLTIFETPAYPAPAHFEGHNIAVMGEIDATGTYRCVLGTLDDRGVTLRPRGIDTSGARLVAFTGDSPTPRDVAAIRDGDRFTTGPIDGDPLYVVAIIGGTPWLVAARKAWRWE